MNCVRNTCAVKLFPHEMRLHCLQQHLPEYFGDAGECPHIPALEKIFRREKYIVIILTKLSWYPDSSCAQRVFGNTRFRRTEMSPSDRAEVRLYHELKRKILPGTWFLADMGPYGLVSWQGGVCALNVLSARDQADIQEHLDAV